MVEDASGAKWVKLAPTCRGAKLHNKITHFKSDPWSNFHMLTLKLLVAASNVPSGCEKTPRCLNPLQELENKFIAVILSNHVKLSQSCEISALLTYCIQTEDTHKLVFCYVTKYPCAAAQ